VGRASQIGSRGGLASGSVRKPCGSCADLLPELGNHP